MERLETALQSASAQMTNFNHILSKQQSRELVSTGGIYEKRDR